MPGDAQEGKRDTKLVEAAGLSQIEREITLERYRFIQQEIRSANENVYRFITIYQTVATTAAGAILALFVATVSGLSLRMWLARESRV